MLYIFFLIIHKLYIVKLVLKRKIVAVVVVNAENNIKGVVYLSSVTFTISVTLTLYIAWNCNGGNCCI